uniref:Pleckstrin homology domain-containing family F member 2 n=1 Tax=Acrobeloides nanus TaxID=290746 RepID=A0A914D831_9BILA
MVDRLRNSEANARRIENVESCFGASGRSLMKPGRVLVGEGVLVKMCRKKPKPRQFFLFNDILVYGTIIIAKKRYSKQHIIPLEEVKIENLEDEGDSRNGWVIKTRTKSFAVFAATPTEKNEWMAHIVRSVQEILRSGRAPAKEHAAVWVPDSEAEKCMCCQSTQFTVLQRRHHCRACGRVVCRGCSSKTFVLEGISKKPVRVCDTCYNKLCQGIKVSRRTELTGNDSSDYSDEEDVPSNSSTNSTDKYEAPTFYEPNSNPNADKLI